MPNTMPKTNKKRTMSPAARKRISLAQKKRWKAFRAAGGTTRNGKPGRQTRGSSSGNRFLDMPVGQLVEEKRLIDEAVKWARGVVR